MADLEAVLADVSYLMAMERSKAPAAKTIKKVTLPDSRYYAHTLRARVTRGRCTQVHCLMWVAAFELV